MTLDPKLPQFITGAPKAFNGKVIIGNGGAEEGAMRGYVALDADTGEYRWHYQTVPGESWDYNSSMDIVLADLEIGGRKVKALMHAPKNGFFYVIDRENGKLISAEPFAHITWASHVDMETGRPVENPGARYEDHYELVYPSPIGAHNWHPMSYNPGTGLVYIPAIDLAGEYDDQGIDLASWQSPDWEFQPGVNVFGSDPPADAGTGTLKAWDPVQQKLVWEVPNPGMWNAGTMTTAGNLVFQGQASGDFVAYAADSGDILWKSHAGLGISAPPVTYSANGRQYVSVLVGWGGAMVALGGSLTAQHGWAYKAQPRRLVTFAPGSEVVLPASPPPRREQPLPAPDFQVDLVLAERGAEIYIGRCTLCHGPTAVSGGKASDLRASAIVLSGPALADVLQGGSRNAMGMPAFAELGPEDLSALQHYIRKQADDGLRAAKAE